MSVHYCQGEAHYSPLRYAHAHQEMGCTMEAALEKERTCCSTKTAVEQPIKKFANKKCCQDELLKSNPSDHHIQSVYATHFEFILPDYSWTNAFCYDVNFPIQQQQVLAYYLEANAPPLYQLYCRLVLYA